MRIVRFDSQERVDLPDMTQVSALVLGEFRRQMRGMLLGPETATTYPNYIVRGYAVEAQAVPDATVRVRLQISGQPLGFAIGAENLGSRIDFGQLIGGDGMDGTLEGNATQTLDFTGQPAATYTVQMRFVLQDGENDNRAFWDEGANSEFIAATDTRELPLIELRLSGAASDEWLDLADVVWDGVSIDGGDITDLRTFIFEGQAGAFDAAAPGAAGGMADFSRSTDRAANGLGEVYPILRALGRQIQDLKGPDSSGNWNWYARVPRPYDPATALDAEQTKHLSSVDTVTYTVGDGATAFGDFNGADGLEDCLQHLEDLTSANLPQHTVIVLKSHAPAGFTWNINTAHTLNSGGSFKKLTIRGQGGGQLDPGHTRLNYDSVAAGIPLFMDEGYLELHDIGDDGTPPTSNITPIAVDGPLRAFNCRFTGRESDGASSSPAISCRGDGTELRGCIIEGRVEISAPLDSTTVVTPTLIERCTVPNGCIDLLASNSGGFPATQDAKLIVRDCSVTMGETHGWGIRGAINVSNHSGCVIEDSTIVYVPDVDGIHGRVVNSSAPFNMHVRNCVIGFDVTPGAHSAGAGGNGAAGTGWGVFFQGSPTRPSTSHRVEGCRFVGGESIDAGGIYVENPTNCSISACEWAFCGAVVGGSYHAITLVDNGGGGWDANTTVDGCHFHEWADALTRAITIDDISKVAVTGCTVVGSGGGGSITGRTSTNVALYLLGSSAMDGIRVVGNAFHDWEPGVDVNRCIVNVASNLLRPVVADNTFENNGGYPIALPSANAGLVHGNAISCGATGRGISTTAAANTTVSDNVVIMGGTARTGIDFGAASTNMASGNRMHIGTFNIASGVVYGAPGGGGARTDLNYLT